MKQITRFLLSGLVASLLTTAYGADRKPNIVFVLADDLGWSDTATYGSKYYETPNIDRLAQQGLKFTSFHACQNCQPTRASFMTGQYGPRTGVYTVGSIDRFKWWTRSLRPVDNVTRLPLEKITIAQALKKAGYTTGLFGKWHLGERGDYHPSKRGFDEAIVTMGKHFDFQTSPPTNYPKGQYLADFLTDRAEDFIERHKTGPFFLYLPHFGVHAPHDAKESLISRFKNKTAAGGHHDPAYAAMIASVDESLGRVMSKLDRLGLSANTVLIFSSDNGGVGGYEREGIQARGITDNAPLRNGKGSLYEGGTRVPFVVRWPGVTPPGSTCDIPAIHVDLFPTFLEIAAAPTVAQTLDGESLASLFRNPKANLRRDAIFQHFPGYLGSGGATWRTTPVGTITSGQWKLMEFFEDGRLELYDLQNDLGEKHNLAQQNAAKAVELQAKLSAWRKKVMAPMPTPHQAGVRPAGVDAGKKSAEDE